LRRKHFGIGIKGMSDRNELLTVYTNRPVADLCSVTMFTETYITEFESDIVLSNKILPQSIKQNGQIITIQFPAAAALTHCGRVTQICVFNTVKLGTSASSP
jgi:hypothetical protein